VILDLLSDSCDRVALYTGQEGALELVVQHFCPIKGMTSEGKRAQVYLDLLSNGVRDGRLELSCEPQIGCKGSSELFRGRSLVEDVPIELVEEVHRSHCNVKLNVDPQLRIRSQDCAINARCLELQL
jgi:hypothetical protein